MVEYELPLTALQADRLAQLRHRETDGLPVPVPHCPAALLFISGELDRSVLTAAVDRMVDRQAALRLRIDHTGSRQLVMDHGARLTVEELPGDNPAEREEAALRLLARRSTQEFDPHDLMAEFSLLPVSDEKSALLIRADQMVCDLWSLNQMLIEIGATYSALANGTEPPAPLPLDYPAAVTDDMTWLDSAAGRTAQDQAAALVRDLRPLDLPAPAMAPPPAPGWRTLRWRIADEDLRKLRAACRSQRCTLFSAVLAAFGTAVGCALELAVVPIQLLLTGRDRAAHKPLIMWRSNTLPVWAPVAGQSLRETLRQVQVRSFETLQVQRVAWPIAAGAQGTPPPDFSLQYIPPALVAATDSDGLSGLEVEHHLGPPCYTGASVDLLVSESDEEIVARCVFRQDLVAAEFAERLLGDVRRLLTALAGDDEDHAC